jgi:hypothetical protein
MPSFSRGGQRETYLKIGLDTLQHERKTPYGPACICTYVRFSQQWKVLSLKTLLHKWPGIKLAQEWPTTQYLRSHLYNNDLRDVVWRTSFGCQCTPKSTYFQYRYHKLPHSSFRISLLPLSDTRPHQTMEWVGNVCSWNSNETHLSHPDWHFLTVWAERVNI